ncbi:MAG: glycosyltransferase [Desulfomonilaceae bacterium]|nr:glycosyltransferase [Desulfomonilaceae bacterium]
MSKPRVFLTGGDGIGWAVDEDLRLTEQALEGTVDLTDLQDCRIVHSVWWEGLMVLPHDSLAGKRIICHVPGEPFRYFSVPAHRHARAMVGKWVTRTGQAARQLQGFGIACAQIPYLIDVNTFKPLDETDRRLLELRGRLNLPADTYLIGSFQRDTEGSDLVSPKLAKGPDVLLEILVGLRRRNVNFHAILAGPRRHWLRRRLDEEQIPFTYVGTPADGDDLHMNSLSRATLNVLYNLLDVYIVSSRSEGGPHAFLEASASRCKVIGTPVGMAHDVLDEGCIFRSVPEAIRIIERDAADDALVRTRERNLRKVYENHRPETAKALFEKLYADVDSVPVFCGRHKRKITGRGKRGQVGHRDNDERTRGTSGLTVGLWHSFFKPPYGGGNQFMMALRKGLSGFGVTVRENELEQRIDAYVLNSIHFDVDRFLAFSLEHGLNVVHRIDGPIHLIRGFDREKDELCFDLNSRFASATVLQSAWTYQRIVEMGYNPVNPVIIHNAADPDIFHSNGRAPFDRNRRTRLISTSWSNNPRKGGPTYKWIEEHLDWDRFEYTFVGNSSEAFDRIRHIPPVPSRELADLLRSHDVYITAGRNDPCSNALIEALACGLPALFLNDGGHPELVGMGGLPFTCREEIPARLDEIVDNYESFQRLIAVPKLEDVAEKYLALIREVIQ